MPEIQNLDIFFIVNAIGSAAFALSGYFIGVRKHLDYMGLFIVSLLTASGGGMLRDVLVGRVPHLLSDFFAFALVFVVIIVASLLRLHRFNNVDKRTWFVLSDSIGLVAFSTTGTVVGIESELPFYGGMILAFLTATGGGIIRDILVNDMPALLKSDFYGTVAILIAGIIYGLSAFDLYNNISVGIVFVCALILRLIAYYKDWHLPRVPQ
jgi:uncharacterized membrane protein YeiH